MAHNLKKVYLKGLKRKIAPKNLLPYTIDPSAAGNQIKSSYPFKNI